MENLLHTYQSIYNENRSWDYFGDNHDYSFNFQNIFSSNFISRFFIKGNKSNVVKEIHGVVEERIIHTVSTFFLGVFLKNNLSLENLNDFKPDFTYIWFLSCLFHDFGYQVEKNKIKFPPEIFTLSKFLRFKKISGSNNFLQSWSPQFIPSEFDIDTIENYFEYCRNKKNFINHGYISSLMLYCGLIKNLEEVKKIAEKEGIEVSNPFFYKKLQWSDSDKDFYRHAAEAVLAHNIWYCTDEKDRKLYEDYKLEKLNIIDKPEYRIYLKKSPLLFLLALADTIEPLKAFPNINPICLLEKIKIVEIQNGFQIEVIDNCLEPKHWFKKIESLNDWLDLTVLNPEDTKSLQINLQI